MHLIHLDIGSFYSTIAFAKNGKVDVALSRASRRRVATNVVFTDELMALGETAEASMKRFPSMSCTCFTELLKEDANVDSVSIWNLSELAVAENGQISYCITYRGETYSLQPVQVLALFIRNLLDEYYIVKKEVVTHVSITVPSTYTDNDRRRVYQACRLLEVPVVAVFSDHLSAMTEYGYFRRSEFDNDTPRLVGFSSMGHSHYAFTVVSYTSSCARVLGTCRIPVGGRDLDKIVYEICKQKCIEQFGEAIVNSSKTRMKLINVANHTKHTFTNSTNQNCFIECLANDEDFSYIMEREVVYDEFVRLYKDQITAAIDTALEMAEITQIEDLHGVEAIGGSMRCPCIEQIVQEHTNKSLSKTLNMEETTARGGVLVGLLIAKNSAGSTFTVEDILTSELSCRVTTDDRYSDVVLCKPGIQYPVRKFMTIPLTVAPQVELMDGYGHCLQKYSLTAAQENIRKIKLQFYVGIDGIASLEQALVYYPSEDQEGAEEGKERLTREKGEATLLPSYFDLQEEELTILMKRFYNESKELEAIEEYKNLILTLPCDIDSLTNIYNAEEKTFLNEIKDTLCDFSEECNDLQQLKDKYNSVQSVIDNGRARARRQLDSVRTLTAVITGLEALIAKYASSTHEKLTIHVKTASLRLTEAQELLAKCQNLAVGEEPPKISLDISNSITALTLQFNRAMDAVSREAREAAKAAGETEATTAEENTDDVGDNDEVLVEDVNGFTEDVLENDEDAVQEEDLPEKTESVPLD